MLFNATILVLNYIFLHFSLDIKEKLLLTGRLGEITAYNMQLHFSHAFVYSKEKERKN